MTAADDGMIGENSSTSAVGAIEFGPLFASGGVVQIDATTLSGSGSVTASGAPEHHDQQLQHRLRSAERGADPEHPRRERALHGPCTDRPERRQHPPERSGGAGSIDINNAFSCTAAGLTGQNCVGNSQTGPALLLTGLDVGGTGTQGTIDNEGGVINITNVSGLYFVADAQVLGQVVNVKVPNGAVVISLPAGGPFIGGNPYSE